MQKNFLQVRTGKVKVDNSTKRVVCLCIYNESGRWKNERWYGTLVAKQEIEIARLDSDKNMR